MHALRTRFPSHQWLLAAAFLLTIAVYWPGLYGTFLFDDYPNIVDNHGVQPQDASMPSLVRAALSSPSSEFGRPLASLSFAANYLTAGLNPYWMKLTNLVIHLLNGLLVFLLAQKLIRVDAQKRLAWLVGANSTVNAHGGEHSNVSSKAQSLMAEGAPAGVVTGSARGDIVAVLVAACWMLLPINLSGVLYVVQRMESMANLFVLLGLIGYVAGRHRMLEQTTSYGSAPAAARRGGLGWSHSSNSTRSFILCAVSITLPTAVGILAKETAVMLPLYAFLVEWLMFGFQRSQDTAVAATSEMPPARRRDRRIVALFLLVLALPMAIGLARFLPGLLNPENWATRDFTLTTRLLSEARIIVDYIAWTLLPSPHALSFYHDNFHISSGLLKPWTTLPSMLVLATLIALMVSLRKRQPLMSLGIALFMGCQLLTGTIIPLELIYEHRNYFASFGLLLAIIPLLAAPASLQIPGEYSTPVGADSVAATNLLPTETVQQTSIPAYVLAVASETGVIATLPMALPRYALLAGLMLCWTALTALTAYAWGNPLRLAEDLANRAPRSPRAQYELGRTYIIYSHYDPSSPFTKLAYSPLERAAALPGSSILPEQALIFMNSHMHLPLKDAWWNTMIAKLKDHKPGVQDESSLGALTQCAREDHCDLPKQRMMQAYLAALSHPGPSARLLAMYGDYAWNVLDDHPLGERMTDEAIKAAPNEPAYRITLVRMLAAQGRKDDALAALHDLQALNIGGSLDTSLNELRVLPGMQ
ncbi:hypothetical protein [Rhodanobacter sp. B04]|uniref:hypothetical protein n=1 Tax=Rhodanobacter sp. B04 TaxID=1945860 RepID=UPI001115773A|nr:hypothetical protein [Rhodanobacter sp. B04]